MEPEFREMESDPINRAQTKRGRLAAPSTKSLGKRRRDPSDVRPANLSTPASLGPHPFGNLKAAKIGPLPEEPADERQAVPSTRDDYRPGIGPHRAPVPGCGPSDTSLDHVRAR